MTVEITRPGKTSLLLESPVMPAAGTVGFGDVYKDLLNYEKLGALVTNPVTYAPWSPALGTRVIPLDSGVLVHTGLPNPGLSKVMSKYRQLWESLPMPIIIHLAATSVEHIRKCVSRIDAEKAVDAAELGLNDDISWQEVDQMVRGAVNNTDKPILVRLPFNATYELAAAAAHAGAAALVVTGPPRGTVRDPYNGKLVSGRLYGPIIKPMNLRLVGQWAGQFDDVPIIGSGGIHSPEDARDYIEAGARAVQIDALTWIRPDMTERITRDLGGLILTRPVGAMADEWFPGIGETEKKNREARKQDTPKLPKRSGV